MQQNKKKILLLGGTGAMGVYLAPELHSLGFQVYITSRSERMSNERDIIYITGDAKDSVFLKKLLSEKFDAIVDFMTYSTEEFNERYNDILDSTSHYLFLSSYRVYGDNKGMPITEDTPRLLDSVNDEEYLSTDEYGLAKARQENLLRAADNKNWTILRPAITYSKERFQLGTMEAHEFLQRALKGKDIIFPKEMLEKKATMSWAGDIAKLISKMVLNDQTKGEAYTVSTAEFHTWREIVNYYKELLGIYVKVVDLETYTKIIGRPYQIKYDRMFDRVIDNTKALEVTGQTQEDFMPLKDGLRIELGNFIKNPNFRAYSKKKDKAIDKVTYSIRRKVVRKLKRGFATAKKLRQQRILTKKIIVKFLDLLGMASFKKKLRTVSKLKNEKKLLKVICRRIIRLPIIKQYRQICYKSKIKNYDGAIITLTGSYNYGSIAQRWALQNYLKKQGYKFKILDMPFMKKMGSKVGNRRKVEAFISNNLDSDEFVEEQAKMFDVFIVGSDQVWRDFFKNWKKFSVFFLKFLGNKRAKRIGYAVSFGHDRWVEPYTDVQKKKEISSYVKRFDAISVREYSGIALVNELGNDAVHVLDPTMLMHREDYSQLIDTSEYANTHIPPLFYYVLDDTDSKREMIKFVSNKLGVESYGIMPNNGISLVAPEVWFKGFRDCEFVITDSFHGMVFSIINHKPFYVFGNESRGLARMTELLKVLGIENRLIDPDNITLDEVDVAINWTVIEEKLEALRIYSGEWLLSALKND